MTTTAFQGPVLPTRGRLRPLGIDEVRITGGFWQERQAVNATATIPHIGGRLESEGWLPNFDLAASGALPRGRRGREFSDSEVYKYLEAVAWEIGRSGDAEHELRLRDTVRRVGAAQEADGYLNTMFGRDGQRPRWSDLEWGHELYCLGHLFQAAVARERTRPGSDDGLLAIARRSADLVCDIFGEDGNPGVCGHPVVEVGLAELARVTGDRRYADQARRFVERRGRGVLRDIQFGRRYFQDDVPVREADVLRGHVVRANYLSAGAVDVAIDSDDDDLLAALRRQWERTIARRTYITGGQGSHHQDEAFGDDWELPPDRAYSETCASIGSIMFAWRLLLADGDARYADLIERTLFNVVATGAAADGRSYFYANTLHQRVPGTPVDPDGTSLQVESSLRAPWFEVSCCPPNISRTFASLAAYLATVDDGGVQVHQYATASVRTSLPDGRPVGFDIDTRYPVDGRVAVTITEDTDTPWTLTLRVPSWASSARLVVRSAGDVDELDVSGGPASVTRAFRSGDVIELHVPIAPRVTTPDPRIDAVRGTVAVERGPEVYAIESIDLTELGIDDVGLVAIDLRQEPFEQDGRVRATVVAREVDDVPWPYGQDGQDDRVRGARRAEVTLIPYRHWANRGPSTMRVWIPVD